MREVILVVASRGLVISVAPRVVAGDQDGPELLLASLDGVRELLDAIELAPLRSAEGYRHAGKAGGERWTTNAGSRTRRCVMRIAIVGVGHVGLVSAAAFGRWGHDVVGLDDDAAKVATLREGRAWFYEPGLQELLDEVIAAGRLTFSSDPGEAIAGAEVVFACVGTPALPDGSPNLAYLEAVAHTRR